MPGEFILFRRRLGAAIAVRMPRTPKGGRVGEEEGEKSRRGRRGNRNCSICRGLLFKSSLLCWGEKGKRHVDHDVSAFSAVR